MIADRGSNGPAPLGHAVMFEDSDGVRWTAREHDGRDIPGHRSDTCLIFESENSVRRVWTYPPDWHTLPAEALERASWSR